MLICRSGNGRNFFPFPFHVFKKPGLDSVSLPKLNQTKHTHYSSWNNDKTRVLVAERFARDIALFGFEFEQR